MNWQPIETAPKGVDVLIYDDYYKGIHIAAEYTHGWVAAEGSDDIYPTHWMPLPEPPEAE